MRNIITVMGIDQTGIIAKVSDCLYKSGVNILDINQTILQNIFTMIMLVDFEASSKSEKEVLEELEKIGKDIGVDIRMQNEEIFNLMHRI